MNRDPDPVRTRQIIILRMMFQFAALIVLYVLATSQVHSDLGRLIVDGLALLMVFGILASAAVFYNRTRQ